MGKLRPLSFRCTVCHYSGGHYRARLCLVYGGPGLCYHSLGLCWVPATAISSSTCVAYRSCPRERYPIDRPGEVHAWRRVTCVRLAPSCSCACWNHLDAHVGGYLLTSCKQASLSDFPTLPAQKIFGPAMCSPPSFASHTDIFRKVDMSK